jgi:hypothetical protein
MWKFSWRVTPGTTFTVLESGPQPGLVAVNVYSVDPFSGPNHDTVANA